MQSLLQMPRCCGRPMKIRVETPRFYEIQCELCDDVAFIRKPRE